MADNINISVEELTPVEVKIEDCVINTGNPQTSKTVSITSNGTVEVVPDTNYTSMKKVVATVNVPTPTPQLQSKSVSIVENGTTKVNPDSGKDGLSEVNVTVNVPTPAPQLHSKSVTITENGNSKVVADAGKDGLSEVNISVNVPTPTPTMQTKEVTITENGSYEYSADSGYDGLDLLKVIANVESGGGSGLEKLIETEFTVSYDSTSSNTVCSINDALGEIDENTVLLSVIERLNDDGSVDDTRRIFSTFFFKMAYPIYSAINYWANTMSYSKSGELYTYRFFSSASAYGVYPNYIYSSKRVTVSVRYYSSYGTNIGTYKMRLYKTSLPAS